MDEVWPASRFFSDGCSSLYERSVFEGPTLRHFQQQQQLKQEPQQQSLQQMLELMQSTNQPYQPLAQSQQLQLQLQLLQHQHQHQLQFQQQHILPSRLPHHPTEDSFSSHSLFEESGLKDSHMLPASSEMSTFPLAQSRQIMPGLEPSGLNSSGRFDSSGRFSSSVGYDPSDRLESSGRFEMTSPQLDSPVEHGIAAYDSFECSGRPSENPLPPLQGSHEAAPPDRAHSIMVDIQDFCWVNEDYCVRVYIPFPGIDAIPPSYISSSFTDSSFCLLIRGIRDGVCYRLALDSLYGEIQPNLCCHLVHKDKLEITLSKVTSGPSDGPDTNIFTWFSLRL